MFICFLYRLFVVFFRYYILYVFLFALLLFFYNSIWMKAAWAAVRNVRQNMRQICESQKTNEKLPQVHLTPLKLRFALKRQTVPQTEPADPQNRSASSFIVCRSLFLVRCLSSPRVVRVVLVSCSGRVLGAQHDCRNVPSTLSLSHLSFVGCVYAAPPSPLCHLPLLHSRLPRWRFQCQASSC